MFFALGGPGSLAGVMAKAGLDDIEEHRIDCELVYADEETTLAAAFLGGPVALAYSRFDADTKASASADYLASIAEFRHGAGYRIPGEFVIVAAHRPGSESSQQLSHINPHHQQQPKEQPT